MTDNVEGVTPESTAEPASQPVRRERHVGRKIIAAAAAGLLALVLVADRFDLLGEVAQQKTEAQLNAEGWAAKLADFSGGSPLRKVTQDFITGSSYLVAEDKPGKGILGRLTSSNPPEQVARHFGSNCLANTSYDPTPGKDPSLAATIFFTTNRPDIIEVVPVNPSLPILDLHGADGDNLTPADPMAVVILGHYDCNPSLYEFYTVPLPEEPN